MRKFNKDKYLRKLKIKRFFRNNLRYFYIVLSCLLCCFLGIYFTYSKFFISDEQAVIRTTVGDFRKSDISVNIYIDGKKVTKAPKKYSGYAFSKVTCNTGEPSWSNDTWKIVVSNVSDRVKCELFFVEDPSYELEFAGIERIVTISKAGYYKLETWGAQGGGNTTYQGGTGAYASGVIYLNSGDKLYVNVGGSGILNASTSGSFSYLTGGYNGGGNSTVGGDPNGYAAGGGSGGGATHIAKVSGLLSTLENNKDDIIIVSAGGGGADTNSYDSSLSHSGTNGSGISSSTTAGQKNSCTIATQTTGYSFGQGGNYTSKTHGAGGGGGGFYGGGGGSMNGPGCGGSSYIGNTLLLKKTMYCNNCIESNSYTTKTISTTCSEETPTENCAKKGNGYARINYLGNGNINIEYYVENEKVNNIPDKDNYVFKDIACDNSSDVTWNNEAWNVDKNNFNENDTCRVYFEKSVSKVSNIIATVDTSGKCPTVNSDGSVTVTGAETTNGYLCKAKDAYGDSYYFRGNVTNNYVKFAGFYWRIVRINGDGSVRVIYDGTSAHANGEASSDRHTGTSNFNNSRDSKAYVGYMYGTAGASTYAETHANKNESALKVYLDNWYKTNILGTSNERYLVDNVFCNDRSLIPNTSDSNSVYFRWHNFADNADNNKMLLTCPQQNDAFTVSDTTNGNRALTYPIGFITTDEVVLAGGWNTDNNKYYLYTGQFYWTGSPYNASYFTAVRSVNESGNASAYSYVCGTLRQNKPVINLNPIVLSDGNGTMDNPYRLGNTE